MNDTGMLKQHLATEMVAPWPSLTLLQHLSR
jgi:hypothetical protein